MEVNCIVKTPSILGECPLWHPIEEALYWVDIVKPAVHRWDPNTQEQKTWPMPSQIGCIALRAKGGLVATLETAFVAIEMPTGKITVLNDPLKGNDSVIFNDGHCDQQGRFWAGTKDLKEISPIATLYRLDPDASCHKMAEGFTVANGIAWSPDNTKLYICDSPERVIYQYDYSLKNGSIDNRRIFAKVPEEAGYPDGLAIDAEGYIWNAHWNGWRITRYAPNGSIDTVIPMPVKRPTDCCFGGPNLTRLYVTSASYRLSAKELQDNPLAGAVFAIETDIQGHPQTGYAG